MVYEKKSVYRHAGRSQGVSEGDWLTAALRVGSWKDRLHCPSRSLTTLLLLSFVLFPSNNAPHLFNWGPLTSEWLPIDFCRQTKAEAMSLLSGPRADEPLGAKAKRISSTLCVITQQSFWQWVCRHRSCQRIDHALAALNYVTVWIISQSEKNRCWYRVSVTIREREGETGRTNRCIHSSVDKKQTVTMAQSFTKSLWCSADRAVEEDCDILGL